MAQKGWMIEKITNFGWVYRRMEPKQLHFSVSYYPKASEFDPEPTEGQLDFQEFCAHTGWRLVCTSAQMQIFCNENEDATPIETDPALEVETVHAAAKKSFLPAYFVLLAVSAMDGALFVSRLLGDPVGLLSSASNLFTGYAWTMLLLICAVELWGYFRWHARAKAAAGRGEFLETASHSRLQRVMLGLILLGFACWMGTLLLAGDAMLQWAAMSMLGGLTAVVLFVNAVKQFLRRKKASRSVNRTVTMLLSFALSLALVGAVTFGIIKSIQSGVFRQDEETYTYQGVTWALSQDELPLTVEDLLGGTYDGYIRERRGSESLLLGQQDFSQNPRLDAAYRAMPSLDYTVTVVKASFLYEWCRESLLNRRDETDDADIPEGFKLFYQPIDASPWGAESAYRLTAQDAAP